ncbi:MAG: hypothetical protein D6730_10845 [Bacteroidetes bacterium]|nr:MAG: hypothetical protein D6730_10845 [Bacteroidota bacterium]
MNMVYRLLCVCCLLCVSWVNTKGQSLLSDDQLREVPQLQEAHHQPLAGRSAGADTLAFSASQPFFDDFSGSSLLPDSSKWMLRGSMAYPLISRHLAVRPPSKGVATFDGADSQGHAYVQISLSAGRADVLRTHCIDLSGLSPANQVALSFFLQPEGLGNQPDNRPPGNVDEFKVFFADNTDPGNNQDNLREVLSVTGGPLREFRQYFIPLTDPAFFHKGFYIQFESHGSLNGYLDHWHLDYVYLAANRTTADTAYHDVSALYAQNSPLAPYSAIPFRQYQQGSFMQPFQVYVSNLDRQLVAPALAASIQDPVGQTPFQGTFQQALSLNLSPYTRSPIDFENPFSEQPILNNAALQLDLEVELGDEVPQNDVVHERFRLDSVFAYDDGEADAAFGLNKSRGFGVQYDLTRPDTLVAVWISFVPTVNCRTTDCGSLVYMQNEAFRLTLWNKPHPDSTQYKQISGSRVRYGDSINHFVRYALDIPQPVSGRFWVGVQQLTSLPIGVGFDRTYPNDAFMYWDSSGVWTPLRLGGSLMIRAELQNGRDLSTAVTPAADPLRIHAFPNPNRGSMLHLQYQGKTQWRSYRLSLFAPDGRMLWQDSFEGKPASIALPAHLSAGLYLLRHEVSLASGNTLYLHEKLLIQP